MARRRKKAPEIKSEGQRCLVELKLGPTHIAGDLGVNPATASRWLSGERQPKGSTLVKFHDLYGIDPELWRLEPGKVPAKPKPPRKREESEPKPQSDLDEVEDALKRVREMQGMPGLTPSEKARLMGEETKLLALRTRMRRDNELLEDRVVRDHPLWFRIKRVMTEVLAPWPEAAEAVIAGLEEIAA